MRRLFHRPRPTARALRGLVVLLTCAAMVTAAQARVAGGAAPDDGGRPEKTASLDLARCDVQPGLRPSGGGPGESWRPVGPPAAAAVVGLTPPAFDGPTAVAPDSGAQAPRRAHRVLHCVWRL